MNVETGEFPVLLEDLHAKDEILADELGAAALTPGGAVYLDAMPLDPGVVTLPFEISAATPARSLDLVILHMWLSS